MKSNAPISLFLHRPKTGGTTLTDFLYFVYRADKAFKAENGFLLDGIYYPPIGLKANVDHLSSDLVRALSRTDINAVIGHFSFRIHKHLNKPFRYLSILRDLVDRIISLFHHMNLDIRLDEFLELPYMKKLDNDMVRRVSGIDNEVG